MYYNIVISIYKIYHLKNKLLIEIGHLLFAPGKKIMVDTAEVAKKENTLLANRKKLANNVLQHYGIILQILAFQEQAPK